MQILKRASGSACTMRAGMCQMSRWRMGGWKVNEVGKRGGKGGWVLNVSSEERLQKGRRKRRESEIKATNFSCQQSCFWPGRPDLEAPDRQGRHGSPSGPRLPLLWVNPFTSPPLPLSPASLLPLHVSPRGLPVAFVINRGMSGLRRHLMFYRGSQVRHPPFRAWLFMQKKMGKKGALRSFRQDIYDFNIYDINEVIIQTKKYSFFP